MLDHAGMASRRRRPRRRPLAQTDLADKGSELLLRRRGGASLSPRSPGSPYEAGLGDESSSKRSQRRPRRSNAALSAPMSGGRNFQRAHDWLDPKERLAKELLSVSTDFGSRNSLYALLHEQNRGPERSAARSPKKSARDKIQQVSPANKGAPFLLPRSPKEKHSPRSPEQSMEDVKRELYSSLEKASIKRRSPRPVVNDGSQRSPNRSPNRSPDRSPNQSPNLSPKHIKRQRKRVQNGAAVKSPLSPFSSLGNPSSPLSGFMASTIDQDCARVEVSESRPQKCATEITRKQSPKYYSPRSGGNAYTANDFCIELPGGRQGRRSPISAKSKRRRRRSPCSGKSKQSRPSGRSPHSPQSRRSRPSPHSPYYSRGASPNNNASEDKSRPTSAAGERAVEANAAALRKLVARSTKIEDKLGSEIEVGKKVLPLSFLMKYKLRAYCYEQGSDRIIRVIAKVISRAQREALQRWMLYAEEQRSVEKEAVAIKVQAIARGAICRRRGELRALVRARRKVFVQYERKLIAIHESRMMAAWTIQGAWRTHRARMAVKAAKASIAAVRRVQTHWRGRRCRMALTVLLQMKQHREQCATRIQALFRGFKGRKVARLLAIEAAFQAREARLADKDLLRDQRFYSTGAALVIQRAYRSRDFRVNVRFRGHELAVEIQRIVRGFLGRTEKKRRIRLGSYARWCLNNAVILEDAAQTIQTAYRGVQSRHLLQQLKHEKDESKRARLEEKARKHGVAKKRGRFSKMLVSKKKRSKAASTIQRFWRGRMTRRMMIHYRRQKIKDRRQSSATLIASVYRSFVARKPYRAYIRGKRATRLQAWWRGTVVRRLGAKRALRQTSATRLQTAWRGRQARRLVARRREMFVAQTCLAAFVRKYLARRSFRAMVEQERFEAESSRLGACQLKVALQNEKDRLLLKALLADPATTKPENSEPLAVFKVLVESGKGKEKRNEEGNKIKDKGKVEAESIGTATFSRYCKDVGIIEPQTAGHGRANDAAKGSKTKSQATGPTIKSNELDILFAKCCMGKRKMGYLEFVDALELIAQQLFPDVGKLRLLHDVDAQLVTLLDKHVITKKWKNKVIMRTEMRAARMALRIQGMFRVWRSRKAARLAKIACDLQRLHAAQERGACYIQRAFRAKLARRQLYLAIRSTYRCFVDTETKQQFWQNPRSGTTTWVKPAALGKSDVDAVIMVPPARHQLVELCSRCEIATVSAYCDQCQDSFCKACCETVHKKGKRASHDLVKIERCSNCSFQLASRSCHDCGGLTFCDTCADHMHRGGAKLHHSLEWLLDDLDICISCGVRAGRFDGMVENGPVCSFCLESHFGVEASTIAPRTYYTKAIRAQWVDTQEKRMKQFMLEQAQIKEDARQKRMRDGAAALVQKNARRFLVRTSPKGLAVERKLLELRETKRLEKEAQDAKKLVNRLKKNVRRLDKIKVFADGLVPGTVSSKESEDAERLENDIESEIKNDCETNPGDLIVGPNISSVADNAVPDAETGQAVRANDKSSFSSVVPEEETAGVTDSGQEEKKPEAGKQSNKSRIMGKLSGFKSKNSKQAKKKRKKKKMKKKAENEKEMSDSQGRADSGQENVSGCDQMSSRDEFEYRETGLGPSASQSNLEQPKEAGDQSIGNNSNNNKNEDKSENNPSHKSKNDSIIRESDERNPFISEQKVDVTEEVEKKQAQAETETVMNVAPYGDVEHGSQLDTGENELAWGDTASSQIDCSSGYVEQTASTEHEPVIDAYGQQWDQFFDNTSGHAYYVCRSTGVTSWEAPIGNGGGIYDPSWETPNRSVELTAQAVSSLPQESEWQEFFDEESGSPYYVSNVTGETSWTAPGEIEYDNSQYAGGDQALESAATQFSEAETTVVGSGWSEFYDEDSGQPYWVHDETGESTWFNPMASSVVHEPMKDYDAEAHYEKCYDEASGQPYWYDTASGETTWNSPW